MAAAVVALGLAACMRSIEITPRGQSILEGRPQVVATYDHYHRGEVITAPTHYAGPLVAVLFSSESDLKARAAKLRVHHIYHDVFACASGPSGAHLLGGEVFDAAGDEERRVGGVEGEARPVYRILLPVRFGAAVRRAAYAVGRDPERELKKAESTGICLRIGGANAWGRGFRSRPARLPLSLQDGDLRLPGVTPPRAGDW